MARSNVFPMGATRLAEVIRTTAPQLPEQLVAQLTADISRVADSSGDDQSTVDEVVSTARQLDVVLDLLADATSGVECDPHAPILLLVAGRCAAELGGCLGRLGFGNEMQLIDASPQGTTSFDARLQQAVALVSLAAGQKWQFNDWDSITQLGWVVFAARDLLRGVLEVLQPDHALGVAA